MESGERRSLLRRYLDFPLIWKLFIALVLGAAAGLILGPRAEVLQPLGDLFLRLLQMLIVPLVLFTLVVGVSSIGPARLGRIGGKVFLYYMLTSVVAITLGIALALFVRPGGGLSMPGAAGEEPAEAPPIGETLLNIVPENPFAAMVEGNVLAVIFFAVLVGLALGAMQSSADERLRELAGLARRLFDAGAEVMFLIVRGVLEYAPVGVFALIAVTLGEVGAEALLPLARLTGVVYGGVALQIGFYALLLLLFGVSLRRFFLAAREPMLTAFVTRSSSGTLPVSIRAAESMGVRKGVHGFSLPFGATVNMDGTALYVGAAVVFVAGVSGVELGFGQLLGVVLVGVLASIGTAGVPGAGLIMLSLAITQAGLPFAAVALVAGIDAILDMARTMCNVTGDLTGTRLVAQTEEGMLDEKRGAPEARLAAG
ncbi:dicarboxylate/amino acid:cation symporter [Rubrobacter taiwanensis]|jgi:Na+/H+-dicarboxylate symporter|uniref:Dicarboxylate/amino acid:cation symporter n=1 Tax=Rubrobacter taiwanensis TaxID=185139 RepID=A0A4R1BG48_9ACTN|nr:dicarboxylate/amino acid:cation symporter [Rubrobacter taiwanensis]TCJ16186.1 dicarboxylate/amino acid:cation symporter [Rubrobacter taiwanensis]